MAERGGTSVVGCCGGGDRECHLFKAGVLLLVARSWRFVFIVVLFCVFVCVRFRLAAECVLIFALSRIKKTIRAILTIFILKNSHNECIQINSLISVFQSCLINKLIIRRIKNLNKNNKIK